MPAQKENFADLATFPERRSGIILRRDCGCCGCSNFMTG